MFGEAGGDHIDWVTIINNGGLSRQDERRIVRACKMRCSAEKGYSRSIRQRCRSKQMTGRALNRCPILGELMRKVYEKMRREAEPGLFG